MKEYTKEQPIDGETILYCGHKSEGPYHWWKFPREVYFRRPDNTVGTACWIVACTKCNEQCNGDGTKIQITADGIWRGNEPEVYRVKS